MMPLTVDPRTAIAFTQSGMPGQNSSFGAEGRTFGTGWQGHNILQGERYSLLQFRNNYYECKQHDSKRWDFDGRVSTMRTGTPGSTGFVGMEKPMDYVPFSQRRPSAPIRLAKVIVDRFTSMLFGEELFPTFQVLGDKEAADFTGALSKAGKLPVKMILARNIGGATGSVGISWCFYNGKPRYAVHNPKNIYVHSWEDRGELIPRHVSEVYLYYEVQWDPKKKVFANKYFWYRRDWTPDWDIQFMPIEFDPAKPTYWEPDLKKSTNHGDGLCHFVWIQNLPSEEVDGFPDYEGVYDKLDEIDIISSVISRGTKANLDPTVVLKVDPDLIGRRGISKGSDNYLNVGPGGDASYMELGGGSMTVGIQVLDRLAHAVQDETQCIILDADKLAAQGLSSVAIRMILGPMISKANLLREQYGTGMERLLEPQLVIARKRSSVVVNVKDAQGNLEVDESGQPIQGKETLLLPPRIETETDPETGEETLKQIPRTPGMGTDIELDWPAFFPPNPTEQTAMITTLQTATGGKAFLSKETATEIAATALGVDPAQERRRLDAQGAKDKAEQAEMTPGIGGEVATPDELPEGATPKKPKPVEADKEPVPPGEKKSTDDEGAAEEV